MSQKERTNIDSLNLMKPIIIAIVGASGSGKTYMAELLRNQLNIPTIVSYTTRQKRLGETNGIEHYFIKDSDIPDKNDMLAYTLFGNNHYFSLHSQVPKEGLCTYVIDEKGLEELTKQFSDMYLIIPVAIKCSQETLRLRGINQERLQRDKGRLHIDDSYYDCIICNNGTIEEFKAKILEEINRL